MSQCWGHDGPCEAQGVRRKQSTAYVNDELNWVVMCDVCFAQREEHWRQAWAEYWADRRC